MKYILVDTNNIFFRCRHVAKGEDTLSRCSMAIHVTLTAIRKIWRNLEGQHVVFALDGRSWRRDIYPPYKAQRRLRQKQQTADEREDDEIFLSALRDFITFLDQRTNVTLLRHNALEADDLIAAWIAAHPDEDHVVVSSDSDFKQLVSPRVSIYDGLNHELTNFDGVYDDFGNPQIDPKTARPKEPPDPEWLLFEKSIRGDSSDNIFSAYPRVRKKVILEAYEDRHDRGYLWNNLMLQTWVDHLGKEHRVLDDYQRNRQLIDLRGQPEDIQQYMQDAIAMAAMPKRMPQIGTWFLSFAARWQLEVIIDAIDRRSDDYIEFLAAPYPKVLS